MQTRPTQGLTLRTVRVAQGLSLRETASRAGIDPAHLSKVERGQKNLSVQSLHKLAGVLGLRDLERLLAPHVTELDAAS